MANGEPLGEHGYRWLLIHGANLAGQDKIPLNERVDYSLEHLEEFIRIAEDPIVNTGWIDKEKPFSFLAFCYEVALIEKWVLSGGTVEDFVSHLPISLDGSVNGIQHLTAMSLDDELAPYVNLVPTELPGDLYSYIGEKVWARLKELSDRIPGSIKDRLPEVLDKASELQTAYEAAPPGSDQKFQAFREVQTWRNNTRKLREQLFPLYWLAIEDKKVRRKIVKR